MVIFCFNIRRAILRRNYDVNIERAVGVARSATCSVGIHTEVVLRRRKPRKNLLEQPDRKTFRIQMDS